MTDERRSKVLLVKGSHQLDQSHLTEPEKGENLSLISISPSLTVELGRVGRDRIRTKYTYAKII